MQIVGQNATPCNLKRLSRSPTSPHKDKLRALRVNLRTEMDMKAIIYRPIYWERKLHWVRYSPTFHWPNGEPEKVDLNKWRLSLPLSNRCVLCPHPDWNFVVWKEFSHCKISFEKNAKCYHLPISVFSILFSDNRTVFNKLVPESSVELEEREKVHDFQQFEIMLV